MKYYLLKRIDSAKNSNFNEKQYVPITEVTAWTRSKEIMLYDEKNNNCWYSFIYEPDAKLTKVKKENIKRQLSFVKENANDEVFHEVSQDIFMDTIKNMIKYSNSEEDKKDLENILNKIESIIKKSTTQSEQAKLVRK